jgi:hypothetical protein
MARLLSNFGGALCRRTGEQGGDTSNDGFH